MDAPTITLDGKKYTAGKPKVKLWREVVRFKEKFANVGMENETAIDEMLRLMSVCFSNPEVTTEAIEEHLDLDQLSEVFGRIMLWIQEEINGKVSKIPNA
jgi:hypothetical protein